MSPGCWPPVDHALLLRCAFAPNDAARVAWRQWTSRHDLASMDYGSTRLLPLVYRRLVRIAESDPQMSILKGLYKRTWFANQLLLRSAWETAGVLERAGIETLPIKGVSSLRHYGYDLGLRPMGDCDLLVHEEDAARAIDVVSSLGWTPKPSCTADYLKTKLVPRHHAWNFARGRAELDLHWHSFPQDLSTAFDETTWRHAEWSMIVDRRVRLPSVTEHLMHTCVHGVRWSELPVSNWAADAANAMSAAGDAIDWNRLVDVALERRLVCPLRDALTFLADVLDLPVPRWVIGKLTDAPTREVERLEHEALTRHPLRLSTEQYRARQTMLDLRSGTSRELGAAPSRREVSTAARARVACVPGWRHSKARNA